MGSLVHEDRKIFSSKGCLCLPWYGAGWDNAEFLVGPWYPILIPCIPQEGDIPMILLPQKAELGLELPTQVFVSSL